MQTITVEFAVEKTDGVVMRIGRCRVWQPGMENRETGEGEYGNSRIIPTGKGSTGIGKAWKAS